MFSLNPHFDEGGGIFPESDPADYETEGFSIEEFGLWAAAGIQWPRTPEKTSLLGRWVLVG